MKRQNWLPLIRNGASRRSPLSLMTVGRLTSVGGVWLLVCLPAAAQMAGVRPTVPVTSCVTPDCHGNVLSGTVLHGPTARKKCQACHAFADPARHLFTLTVPQHRLCGSCHVQSHRTFVHEPAAEGDCTACHDPHGSNHRFLLVEDPAEGLCFRCHLAEEFESRKYVHEPVAAGACVVCHEAHSSWRPKLLATEEQDLCLLCHADTLVRLELSRHAHEPVVEGRCLTCHDPHASDQRGQLREGAPELCFSCHQHDPIRELVETSSHVHGAIATEDSCTVCHTGHGGPLPKLLAEPLMSLCLSCHAEPVQTAEGRRLSGMAALLRENPNHHGPVRRADCSACHNPHAAPYFSLLSDKYPALFYAPFDLETYELCFTCHLKEMVTVADGVGVTGFRDGQRNLHFLHVNKREKGRTCRACHEVHASKRPFHIRDKVPFGRGGWEIELNFEALPKGGRCAPGCHEEQSYSREPAGTGRAASAWSQSDASK